MSSRVHRTAPPSVGMNQTETELNHIFFFSSKSPVSEAHARAHTHTQRARASARKCTIRERLNLSRRFYPHQCDAEAALSITGGLQFPLLSSPLLWSLWSSRTAFYPRLHSGCRSYWTPPPARRRRRRKGRSEAVGAVRGAEPLQSLPHCC